MSFFFLVTILLVWSLITVAVNASESLPVCGASGNGFVENERAGCFCVTSSSSPNSRCVSRTSLGSDFIFTSTNFGYGPRDSYFAGQLIGGGCQVPIGGANSTWTLTPNARECLRSPTGFCDPLSNSTMPCCKVAGCAECVAYGVCSKCADGAPPNAAGTCSRTPIPVELPVCGASGNGFAEKELAGCYCATSIAPGGECLVAGPPSLPLVGSFKFSSSGLKQGKYFVGATLGGGCTITVASGAWKVDSSIVNCTKPPIGFCDAVNHSARPCCKVSGCSECIRYDQCSQCADGKPPTAAGVCTSLASMTTIIDKSTLTLPIVIESSSTMLTSILPPTIDCNETLLNECNINVDMKLCNSNSNSNSSSNNGGNNSTSSLLYYRNISLAFERQLNCSCYVSRMRCAQMQPTCNKSIQLLQNS